MSLPRFNHYVALGDSISIDDYPGDGHGASSLLLAALRDTNPDCRLSMLAMDGATSSQVVDWELAGLVTLVEQGIVPDLYTLTVGGNDFITFYGSDAERVSEEVARVRGYVDQALAAIRAIAPEATILVGTIYDPSDGTGELGDMSAKDWPGGPQALLDLNATLLEAATAAGAIGTDIHGLFLGHGRTAGAVDQPPPGTLDDPCWFCNVIEPNRAGAKAVADLWAQTLQTLQTL